MIIRIVKMTFDPQKTDDFLKIFDESKQLIREMKGCSHLELLSDINSPNIYFTYSYWNSESDLNEYRNSPLFADVWTKTKALFSAKAEAWSLQQDILL